MENPSAGGHEDVGMHIGIGAQKWMIDAVDVDGIVGDRAGRAAPQSRARTEAPMMVLTVANPPTSLNGPSCATLPAISACRHKEGEGQSMEIHGAISMSMEGSGSLCPTPAAPHALIRPAGNAAGTNPRSSGCCPRDVTTCTLITQNDPFPLESSLKLRLFFVTSC